MTTRFERLAAIGMATIPAVFLVAGLAGAAPANEKPPEKPTATAAPKPVEKTPATATPQTMKAVSELGGRFTWGMTTDEAMRTGIGDIEAWFNERIKTEKNQFRIGAFKKGMADETAKFRASFVKFDGQTSGWDVSVIDTQFVQRNNEAMMELRGIDERRFLFFWNDRLWRQVIVFDRENLAFAGKTFDDFAEAMVKRFGPAGVFHKVQDSEEEISNRIEWPLVGDSELRGLDLFTYHGSYALSLSQRSKVAAIDAARKSISSRALADAAGGKGDSAAEGSAARPAVSTAAGATAATAVPASDKKGAKAPPKGKDGRKQKDAKDDEDDTVVDPNLDPLQGVDL